MKTAFFQLCLIIFVISGLHAIKLKRAASIKGVVLQDERIKKIWAVQGRDSTEVLNQEGAFDVVVKPGIWKIIINMNDKYQKSRVLENIRTSEGKNTDLGKIDLN